MTSKNSGLMFSRDGSQIARRSQQRSQSPEVVDPIEQCEESCGRRSGALVEGRVGATIGDLDHHASRESFPKLSIGKRIQGGVLVRGVRCGAPFCIEVL